MEQLFFDENSKNEARLRGERILTTGLIFLGLLKTTTNIYSLPSVNEICCNIRKKVNNYLNTIQR